MINMTKFPYNLLKGSVNGIITASLSLGVANAASIEELQAKAAQVEVGIKETIKQQKVVSQKLADIEKKYEKELSMVEPKGTEAYNAKIAEAKAKKQEQSQTASEAVEANDKEKITKTTKEEQQIKQSSSVPAFAQERKPNYVAPRNSNRGRRPFTRSDNTLQPEKIYYASRRNSEELSFAKEDSVKAYTGTTEENVFIFSDNLANYCEMDTTMLDKMSDCLNKLIKERSDGSQTIQEQVNELYQDSLIDTTAHAIADAARYKNDSSRYEKNVLLPLSEKSSEATDERGDIEVLTLTEMEALKLKNKLIQIYANQLGLDSFRDYGTYEVNNRDLTNIDEEENK